VRINTQNQGVGKMKGQGRIGCENLNIINSNYKAGTLFTVQGVVTYASPAFVTRIKNLDR